MAQIRIWTYLISRKTKEAREALNGYVLDAYEQKMEQAQAEQQPESEELDEDEEPAFEQSM